MHGITNSALYYYIYNNNNAPSYI